MTKRSYFLACLNVHLTASFDAFTHAAQRGSQRLTIVEVQSHAWCLPEEAIPADPARAALEFFDFYCGSNVAKPEWIVAWEETLT